MPLGALWQQFMQVFVDFNYAQLIKQFKAYFKAIWQSCLKQNSTLFLVSAYALFQTYIHQFSKYIIFILSFSFFDFLEIF